MAQVSGTGQQVCHIQVRDIAIAAAGELYGQVMSNNEYFRVWKKQNPGLNTKQLERRFIDQNWPKCIEFARTTLTVMLTRDDIPEKMKEEIMDVLEKDYSLRNKVAAQAPFPNTRLQ